MREGALIRRAIEKEETTAPKKETEAAPSPGQKSRLLTPLEGTALTKSVDLFISQLGEQTSPILTWVASVHRDQINGRPTLTRSRARHGSHRSRASDRFGAIGDTGKDAGGRYF